MSFSDDSNPFADTSKQQPTASTFSSPPKSNDNNPFASANTPVQPPPQPSAAAYLTPSQPPAYQPSAYTPVPTPPVVEKPVSSYVDVSGFERRQTELDEREQHLAERERTLKGPGGAGQRDNNFPPLPSICPCRPCFVHDINLEIPLHFQRWVRMVFYLWIFYSFTLFLNMIAGLTYFLHTLGGASTFGLSLFYLVLFVPLSYICWFRPIYRAFKTDSSVFFMLFFFIDISFIATNVLFAIGVVDGMCGFARSGLLSTNKILGFMMIVLGGLWSLIAVAAVLLTIKIHRLYRQSGASLEQAQKEFQTNFVNNPTVRGAAREAASAGINAALNSDSGPATVY